MSRARYSIHLGRNYWLSWAMALRGERQNGQHHRDHQQPALAQVNGSQSHSQRIPEAKGRSEHTAQGDDRDEEG
jgi:hypothetical protein